MRRTKEVSPLDKFLISIREEAVQSITRKNRLQMDRDQLAGLLEANPNDPRRGKLRLLLEETDKQLADAALTVDEIKAKAKEAENASRQEMLSTWLARIIESRHQEALDLRSQMLRDIQAVPSPDMEDSEIVDRAYDRCRLAYYKATPGAISDDHREELDRAIADHDAALHAHFAEVEKYDAAVDRIRKDYAARVDSMRMPLE